MDWDNTSNFHQATVDPDYLCGGDNDDEHENRDADYETNNNFTINICTIDSI